MSALAWMLVLAYAALLFGPGVLALASILLARKRLAKVRASRPGPELGARQVTSEKRPFSVLTWGRQGRMDQMAERPPHLVTIRVVPDGAKFAVVTYVDGQEVDRMGNCTKSEARRAAQDLESMLTQTGGKLPPKGVQ